MNGDASGSPVDDKLAGGEHLAVRDRGPPKHRSNPREQLFVRERPAEDVVRASVERAHTIDRVRGRRQEDHGDVSIPCPARLAATQPEAELELLEEHEIGSGLLREVEGLARARRAEDVEAVVAQLAAEILARFRLELCDEDCARHATDASGASRSTPDVLCGGTVTTAPHPSERVSACRNNGAASWRRLKAGFARRKGYATSSVRGGSVGEFPRSARDRRWRRA